MNAKEFIEQFRTEEETFTVTLRGGVSVAFRVPVSAEEFYILQKQARRWVQAITRNPSPAMKAYLPLSDEVMEQCFWVKALATDPVFSDAEILQLAKECGATLPLLYTSLMTRIARQVMQLEQEEVEAQGEDLGKTSTTETA